MSPWQLGKTNAPKILYSSITNDIVSSIPFFTTYNTIFPIQVFITDNHTPHPKDKGTKFSITTLVNSNFLFDLTYVTEQTE
jgi:hypothetical protein